ncbi:hypothetical protein DL98DRAFT_521375 [Cadophora sp. DSE1049]|nr:hypothetical protein DL98DRAFT_521375 [Cadophora sp. DSE1049]
MASIQLTYSLRYTLLPVIPTFIVFFLAILFTPPPHPVFTIHIYGPQLHGRISTASPLKRVDIACLQYPWPISGWIETRPIRWAMFGCVVVHENTARWRSLNLSPKERAEEEARRRVWREEWGRKSWVGKKLSEMMTELLYVGTGARFLILGGVVLLCMAVL